MAILKYYILPNSDPNFSFDSWISGHYFKQISPNLRDQFGQVNLVKLRAAVVSHLKLILATWMGELGHLPTYGNPLFYLKFDQAALESPQHRIQLQNQLVKIIEIHEPRLTNISVELPSIKMETLSVRIKGNLKIEDAFGNQTPQIFSPVDIPFTLS